ncbi:transglycosylase SLT domain-containing protein [Actinoplanes sp. NPDC089786]|uniref:aggregation-promoting factor C-terminal-like domain-containing protein n=1 Tax=Actinoplanes sp. NPDC089786 TaxID=3155185 RepID=UPI003429BB47
MRLFNAVGVRVVSVGLLVAGVVGGVHLAGVRSDQRQSAHSRLVLQAGEDEAQLLNARQNQVAAARAWERQAESQAAVRAAAAAKDSARRARAVEKKAKEKKKKTPKPTNGTVPYSGPIPSSCTEYSGNRKTGCALMLAGGFAIDQFPCLEKLWKHESGWNHKAENKGSGAYGIPQALPGSKMGSIASDWRTNPATQIKWGLGYVKKRYKSPCGAWSHFQSAGNY